MAESSTAAKPPKIAKAKLNGSAPPKKPRKPRTKKPAQSGYPPRLKDKVAIVGFAPHRDQAPFGDPDFELWGLNRLHVMMPGAPFDRWFEIHNLDAYHPEADADHYKFLAQFPGPIYLRPQDVGRFPVPNGVALPLGRIMEDFHPYFNNSIAYELAMAIGMGFSEIHLYGVDMAQDTVLQAEYAFQRPSCEFFLGIAVGRNIKVVLPSGSDLLITSHLYGIEEIDPIRGKKEARFLELGARKNELRNRIGQLNGEVNQLGANLNQMDGAMQEIEYELRNLSPVHDHRICVTGKIPPVEETPGVESKPTLKPVWK